VKLNNNGGFGPFGSDMTKETRELDENMNERKSRSQRRGRADHDDPSITLPGNDSAWFPPKCNGGNYKHDVVLGYKCREGKAQDGNEASWIVDDLQIKRYRKNVRNAPKNHILYS
jgi:hypothetical protein